MFVRLSKEMESGTAIWGARKKFRGDAANYLGRDTMDHAVCVSGSRRGGGKTALRAREKRMR